MIESIFIIIIIFLFKLTTNVHNTAIIFRIKNISKVQKEYISRYYKQCKSNYDIWFLIDGYGISKYPKYYITSSDVMNYFPQIKSFSQSCMMFNRKDINSTIGYATFTEQLVIWYESIKSKYEYMWYIEQDLIFLGNINSFFNSYDKCKSNIIFIDELKKDISNKWIWKSCKSKELNISDSQIYHGYIFLTRIDKEVIRLLYMINKQRIHLYCERVLHYLLKKNNLTHTIISTKWKGYILCCCKINYKTWLNISNNKIYKNKFFHSIKF